MRKGPLPGRGPFLMRHGGGMHHGGNGTRYAMWSSSSSAL